MISTAVELAGFACLVVAAWLWVPVVGLLVLGVVLLVIGYALPALGSGRRKGGDGKI